MENNSGIIQLCEYKCLVLPDPVEEVTAGGLYKPRQTVDSEENRTCKATFILGSGSAFTDWPNSYRPEPGDRIYVAVAAGMKHTGPDGLKYRIVNDKDIIGQLDPEQEGERSND